MAIQATNLPEAISSGQLGELLDTVAAYRGINALTRLLSGTDTAAAEADARAALQVVGSGGDAIILRLATGPVLSAADFNVGDFVLYNPTPA